MDRIVIALTKF